MPPSRSRHRQWTNFERNTILSLMAKGVHLEHHGGRFANPTKVRDHAYVQFAKQFIESVHGKMAECTDRDKRDIARAIDTILAEKKGIMGRGGYMERSKARCITRGLKRLFDRPSKFNYNGSLAEWKQYRREEEAKKLRIAKGLEPKETVGVLEDSDEDRGSPGPVQGNLDRSKEDYWRQADVAAKSGQTKWANRGSALTDVEAEEYRKARMAMTAANGRDSYGSIPENLRGSGKFDWVNNFNSKVAPKPKESSRGHGVVGGPGKSPDRNVRATHEGYDTSVISALVDNSGPAQDSQPATSARPTSYAKPTYFIPSYGMPSNGLPALPTYRPSEFATMRLKFPSKQDNSPTLPLAAASGNIPRQDPLADEIDTNVAIFQNPVYAAKQPKSPTRPLAAASDNILQEDALANEIGTNVASFENTVLAAKQAGRDNNGEN